MSQHTYPIIGMHCAACVRKVQAVLEPLADKVIVTLQPPQVTVEGSVPFERLNAAVKGVGTYTLKRPVPAKKSTALAVSPIVTTDNRTWLQTYFPLLMIAGYITVGAIAASLTLATWAFDPMEFMRVFMAGFFLTFSFFKFLNLKGFADAYAGYDLLAARWRGYGYVYPFLELALGLAYAFNLEPLVTNAATAVLMAFSLLGVLKALADKKKIRCACLGTVLNLPMTTVTVIEDALMVAMALTMVVMLA
ncbi:MAG: hypothetical protein DI585_00305 [Pseudomonas fluorescens]|nr:MAG: hypothetical protein DI585_00305 [Pseudomonas fluorescens]